MYGRATGDTHVERSDAHHDDARLVARAQQGDHDAFTELVRRYSDRLHGIAYARLLNHADAEEAVQESFLRAYERLGQLRSPAGFGGWLARIAVSRASEAGRRKGREELMARPEKLTVEDAASDEHLLLENHEAVCAFVQDALRRLPASLRTPLVMRYMSDASYKEIARLLLISPGTAQQRVRRGLDGMRRYLRQRGDPGLAPERLLSLPLACPLAAEVAARVAEAVLPLPPPATARTAHSSTGGPLVIGAAAGVALTCAVVTTQPGSRVPG